MVKLFTELVQAWAQTQPQTIMEFMCSAFIRTCTPLGHIQHLLFCRRHWVLASSHWTASLFFMQLSPQWEKSPMWGGCFNRLPFIHWELNPDTQVYTGAVFGLGALPMGSDPGGGVGTCRQAFRSLLFHHRSRQHLALSLSCRPQSAEVAPGCGSFMSLGLSVF